MNKKNLLLSALLVLGSLTSCGGSKTGEAYGLVHGAGYVGKATATYSGEKISAATLVEVCFPTHVVAKEGTAASDYVTATVTDHGKEVEKNFYKTISYGSKTFTYDADKKDYVMDGKAFKALMADEANCKEYYDAVIANKVSVMIGGNKDTTILCKATLCKEDNDYWGSTRTSGLGWIANRDATIAFLLENGIDSLKRTTKNADTKYWEDGDAVSGATWTDMNSTKEGSNSYAQLLGKACDNAKK